jgi:hypothetical protein
MEFKKFEPKPFMRDKLAAEPKSMVTRDKILEWIRADKKALMVFNNFTERQKRVFLQQAEIRANQSILSGGPGRMLLTAGGAGALGAGLGYLFGDTKGALIGGILGALVGFVAEHLGIASALIYKPVMEWSAKGKLQEGLEGFRAEQQVGRDEEGNLLGPVGGPAEVGDPLLDAKTPEQFEREMTKKLTGIDFGEPETPADTPYELAPWEEGAEIANEVETAKAEALQVPNEDAFDPSKWEDPMTPEEMDAEEAKYNTMPAEAPKPAPTVTSSAADVADQANAGVNPLIERNLDPVVSAQPEPVVERIEDVGTEGLETMQDESTVDAGPLELPPVTQDDSYEVLRAKAERADEGRDWGHIYNMQEQRQRAERAADLADLPVMDTLQKAPTVTDIPPDVYDKMMQFRFEDPDLHGTPPPSEPPPRMPAPTRAPSMADVGTQGPLTVSPELRPAPLEGTTDILPVSREYRPDPYDALRAKAEKAEAGRDWDHIRRVQRTQAAKPPLAGKGFPEELKFTKQELSGKAVPDIPDDTDFEYDILSYDANQADKARNRGRTMTQQSKDRAWKQEQTSL